MPDMKMCIPNDARWPVAKLGDVCALISRGTAPVYVECSDVMAIGQRCVTVAGFDAGKARPHSHRAMRGVVEPASGDVLLNSTGTGTIGRSCVFGQTGQFVADGHVTVLRPKPGGLDGRWLNAVLRSAWGQSHLERFCYAGSTNQVELNRVPLAATCLPLPPIHEQRLAAEVLETLDTTIRQTEAIIEKLKQIKQGLLHDLLTLGIADNGELRPPQSEASQMYKDSALGWIPISWNVLGLADMSSPSRSVLRTGPFGSSLKGEHLVDIGHPVVTIGSLGDGHFIESELLHVSESTALALSDSQLLPGDIAFSRVADVGRSVVVEEQQRGWIMSSNFMRIAVDPGLVVPHFLQRELASDFRVKRQIRATVNSAGRDVASTAILMSLRFAMPPTLEQYEIVRRARAVDMKIEREESVRLKFWATHAGLMDDILTGRVRVGALQGAKN